MPKVVLDEVLADRTQDVDLLPQFAPVHVLHLEVEIVIILEGGVDADGVGIIDQLL